MGYRGKVVERERARELRAAGWTYAEISQELGVSRSSVSGWARDVPVGESVWSARVRANRNHGARIRRPHPLHAAKELEVRQLREEGRERLGRLAERELLLVGTALYAGEGSKTDGAVRFANSDPRMIVLFLAFLRHHFEIDETRLRLRLYLHQGLDLDAAVRFWSALTGIPVSQFGSPYRAVPGPSIRRSKHPMGCPSVVYSCSRTHRAVMGLVDALLSCDAAFRGGEIGITADC